MLQRYEWEDALIEAQTNGIISNGALMVALKLAAKINWSPTNLARTEPGLYWKNDDAFKAAGVGRSTFYRRRAELFDAGFFDLVGGNLIPRPGQLTPGSAAESRAETKPNSGRTNEQSSGETRQSLDDTNESLSETKKSPGGQPLSEDTFTVDLLSEDALSEDNEATASPSPRRSLPSLASLGYPLDPGDFSTSSLTSSGDSVKEDRESLVGTGVGTSARDLEDPRDIEW